MKAESERILVLAPSKRDGEIARAELSASGFQAAVCASMERLAEEIESGAGAALLTEEALVRGAAARLRAALARQPPWSDFPLLVLASRAPRSERSQEELRAFGNVTLLDPPLRVRSMCQAAESALRGRRRQYEAARAIAERDRFLAMLGHELRNPLSAIALALEVTRAKVVNAPREMAIMKRQVEHLRRMVDDLLDVARVTSGKIVLQTAPVHLGKLLDRVLELVSPRFAAAGVALVVPEGVSKIFAILPADPVRLEQAFSNILANALKYTPRGGRVEVRLEVDSSSARVVVKDDGVGISPEMLPRIFDAFAQADDSLARSQGGVGIGLTLVRTIVELHGGSVRAASEGLGCGSRFEVRLPISSELSQKKMLSSNGKTHPLARSVVLVDDHADSLELLALTLEIEGHAVVTATDGAHGVRLILEKQPDIAFIDIGLPDFDGFEVARRVRGHLGPSVRLVALTGYGQPEDQARSRAAGFDAHLTKPAEIAKLRSELERI